MRSWLSSDHNMDLNIKMADYVTEINTTDYFPN